MKLLIIGASGVLGSRMYNDTVRKKWNVLGTFCSHESEGLFHLDVRDRKNTEKIFNFFNPEVVIWGGGITDVDLCESKPKLAEDVNIRGSLNLLKRAKERNAKFIFLSTDYVFNGESGPYKEEDNPCPINVYGRVKLEAEQATSALLKDSLIVRTAQLYGFDAGGRNFALKIIRNMHDKKTVYAADDFYCTPTYAGNLSLLLIQLIERHKKGFYHAAGTDFLNRYDYVSNISDIFGLDRAFIKRVKLKDLHLKAKRPKKAGLKVDKIQKEVPLKLLDTREGLELFKKELV